MQLSWALSGKEDPKAKILYVNHAFINEINNFCFFRIEPLCFQPHTIYGFIYESLSVTRRITSDFTAHIRITKRGSNMLSQISQVFSVFHQCIVQRPWVCWKNV